LYVAGGSVSLSNDIFNSNHAFGGQGGFGVNADGIIGKGGDGGEGAGGALYVAGGSVKLLNDTLSSNRAFGGAGGVINSGGSGGNGGNGGAGAGGGLYAAGGTVTLLNDTVSGNWAVGGSGAMGGHATKFDAGKGGNGGAGMGGGLYVAAASSITLSNDTLSNNDAAGSTAGKGGNSGVPGAGGVGGAGMGGGLYVEAASSLTLSNNTLSNNYARGGSGGNGGNANPPLPSYGFGSLGGNGGAGGSGFGGGLYLEEGSISLVNDTLYKNSAYGGKGGPGANGSNDIGISKGGGNGGNGGWGGMGEGGGLYAAGGSVTLLNDTVALNVVLGGDGGNGGNGGAGGWGGHGGNGGNGGDAEGGGAYMQGSVFFHLANTLIAENSALASNGGIGGAQGLGGDSSNGSAGSAGIGFGPDVFGSVSSSDHDLIGNTSFSSGFSAANGDILNPSSVGLGPLADNGGPTQTMALLPGSPAIDAGDSHALDLPATDQRDFARIVGKAVDIGAYEFAATPATTDLSIHGTAPAGVTAGGQIIFQVTVTNSSSSAQSNVTLTENLPANTTLVSWTPAAGWNKSAPAAGSGSGTVTAWTASLAALSSATFTLVVRVNSGTPAGTVLSATASFGPVAGNANPATSSISLTTTVVTPVNVSADVSVKGGSLSYNSALNEFVQTITLTNSSGSTLFGPLALQLTNLSSNATLANANGTQANGNPYVDFLSAGHSLAAGQSITVTLYFRDPSKQGISYDTQVWKGL
jgi:uncharacterized repeat protein (TIGR01451 family)